MSATVDAANRTPPAARLTLKQQAGRWLIARMPITRALFDQLRVEANAAFSRVEPLVSPAARRRLRELADQRGVMVNVACGPQVIAGFVNIDLFRATPDVVRFDCRRRLPFADASARAIKIEHFLEHLDPREELPALLAECRRVLEPRGLLRVAVPDAARYLAAYCEGTTEAFRALGVNQWPGDLPTRMDLVNHVFHQWSEHRWAYDEETLTHRLEQAGFRDIARQSFGRSRLNELGAADLPVHEPYSLYMEAVNA